MIALHGARHRARSSLPSLNHPTLRLCPEGLWVRSDYRRNIMLIVTGYMHVEPMEVPRFHAELQDVAAVVRRRAGNLSYDAAVDDAGAGRLLIVERWRDQVSLTARLGASETRAFVQRWQGRMRGEIRKYDASNERDLMAD